MTTLAARNLQAGDTILVPDGINLPVTSIRPAICGFVIIEYAFAGGTCERGYAADQTLTINRPAEEAAH